MKALSRSILEDYEVPVHAPSCVRVVQFGMDAVLLGLIDRLVDEGNAEGADVGIAAVQTGAHAYAENLKKQDGLYTVFVRGDLNEKEIKREEVVQCVLEALDPAEDDARLMALAVSKSVEAAVLRYDEVGEFEGSERVTEYLLTRFMVERWRAKQSGLSVMILSEQTEAGNALRETMLRIAEEWHCGDGFKEYMAECSFVTAFADSLCVRSDPDEALRLCRDMNYKDTMIHLCEPYGLWVCEKDEKLEKLFGKAQFADSVTEAVVKKQRVFDAGLFSLTALGVLHGNGTLADCIKDEPLRDLIGHALMDEILPALPFAKEEIAPYIIACYERYGNPLNENRLEDAGRGLIRKCRVGVLPAIKAYAEENFTAPKHLTAALAATILLYADARKGENGYATVAGGELFPVHEKQEILEAFSMLASDMEPESLAYAVLSDLEIWGEDLRQIDGLADALVDEMCR